jgi:hypothetical protein
MDILENMSSVATLRKEQICTPLFFTRKSEIRTENIMKVTAVHSQI